MQAVILIGIPASGKSTFYRRRFFDTHVRINLDMLKTRHRERVLLRACLEGKQPFVVDNTNATKADRQRYIPEARKAKFRVIGYYFQSLVDACLWRNAGRTDKDPVPEPGVRTIHARLQVPTLDEGFDALYYVQIAPDEAFLVNDAPG
jgi:predicted kinase